MFEPYFYNTPKVRNGRKNGGRNSSICISATTLSGSDASDSHPRSDLDIRISGSGSKHSDFILRMHISYDID